MQKEEDQEAITLEEKLEKYENLLDELVEEKTNKIGVIIAGPDEDGFFRTLVESTHLLLKTRPELYDQLEPEMEVVVIDNLYIDRILSEELKIVVEDYNFQYIDWTDIGGLKSQVNRIRDAVEGPLKNKKLYEDFGLTPLKGLLLYGPPGVGKTLVAKAIASTILQNKNATKDNFVYIKGGELLSKYVGETEGNIKRIFNGARETKNKTGNDVIIFIDEAEAIVPRRGSRLSSDVETTIVPAFLAEMDGLNQNNPFVILATNHPNNIDDAILRPGRIDIKIEIDRPTFEDTKEIFEIYFKKTLCKDPVPELIETAAVKLFENKNLVNQVSGALIQNTVQQTTLTALNRYSKAPKSAKGITVEDLITTFNEM